MSVLVQSGVAIPANISAFLNNMRPDLDNGTFSYIPLNEDQDSLRIPVTQDTFAQFRDILPELLRTAHDRVISVEVPGGFGVVEDVLYLYKIKLALKKGELVVEGLWRPGSFSESAGHQEATFLNNSGSFSKEIGLGLGVEDDRERWGVCIRYLENVGSSHSELRQLVNCDSDGQLRVSYGIEIKSELMPLFRHYLGLNEAPLYEVGLEIARRVYVAGQFSDQELGGGLAMIYESDAESDDNIVKLEFRDGKIHLPPDAVRPRDDGSFEIYDQGSKIVSLIDDNVDNYSVFGLTGEVTYHGGQLAMHISPPLSSPGLFPLKPDLQSLWHDIFNLMININSMAAVR